ncbi:Rz1-like lysis system protein LysC [Raoultella ornithinolytica]|uniref:Rz1-like lysis system protein LysC n=1 Tax=Enterobacteriaceae TaxID=543 RepID=UPI0015FB0F57|nr:Rz1 lytic protein [Enterobacter roggenkampii]MBA7914582.1 Rz1 lytic protein [Enterobacter roggenkampii]
MPRIRSHWTHREPRKASEWLLQAIVALIALCLLLPLSGCKTTRTVYVKVPVVTLPASLTSETAQPAIPDPLTYGASLDLNVSLLSALATCNIDKASIRKIEASRSAE